MSILISKQELLFGVVFIFCHRVLQGATLPHCNLIQTVTPPSGAPEGLLLHHPLAGAGEQGILNLLRDIRECTVCLSSASSLRDDTLSLRIPVLTKLYPTIPQGNLALNGSRNSAMGTLLSLVKLGVGNVKM